MSQITPTGYLSRLGSWGYECLQSQVTQLKAPLRFSFPSWNTLFDLASRVKYFALGAFILFVLYNKVSANPPPGGTFTITKNGRQTNISCDQNIVTFPEKLSEAYISELTRTGYSGFENVDDNKWKNLLDQQDYIEILKIIRTEKNLNTAIAYLESAAEEGHAILMLELSRTLCKKMKDEKTISTDALKTAYTWYMRGMVTTMLDTACNTDRSTEDASGRLQLSYSLTNLFSEPELKNIDRTSINSDVLNNWKLLTSYPSPKWVIYHGWAIHRGENRLLPKDKWDEKRTAKLQEIKDACNKKCTANSEKTGSKK
jgi:hypothetical protein